MRNIILLCAVAALLCACHGVSAGPIVAGVAGGVAVLDQLLAGGVIDPIQHHQLATALQDVGKIATDAVSLATETKAAVVQTKAAVDAVKDGALSENEALGYGLPTLLAALAAFNKWRDTTRKIALAAPVPAPAPAVA